MNTSSPEAVEAYKKLKALDSRRAEDAVRAWLQKRDRAHCSALKTLPDNIDTIFGTFTEEVYNNVLPCHFSFSEEDEETFARNKVKHGGAVRIYKIILKDNHRADKIEVKRITRKSMKEEQSEQEIDTLSRIVMGN
jgi:hypothetical protein